MPNSPVPAIRQAMEAAGLPCETPFTRLAGGRTNHVFRCGDLVAKLFVPLAANPMFANSAEAEWTCLTALRGTGLAPAPVARLQAGQSPLLIWRHLPGRPWRGDPAPVAEMLGRLHSRPTPGLPAIPGGAKALAEKATLLLGQCPTGGQELLRLRPQVPELPEIAPAFIHGDVTPSNIVTGTHGMALIDWQCPAIGDPAEDLAIFLSPAMQILFGQGPLTPEQQQAFLDAYPDQRIVTRYRHLAPLFHWRMAAYCLWQVGRGASDYAAGLKAEINALTGQIAD